MENKNDLGLMIQFILIFWVIIFSIITMIEQAFFNGMEILLSATLLTMAYNNQKMFKKKYLTVVYILVALLILLSLVVKI